MHDLPLLDQLLIGAPMWVVGALLLLAVILPEAACNRPTGQKEN